MVVESMIKYYAVYKMSENEQVLFRINIKYKNIITNFNANTF